MKHKIKKTLGQNFLINPKIAERIVRDTNISDNDIVLEIGPGTGNLTKYLLAEAKRVIAVEKDDNLFSDLQNKFSEQIKSGNFILVHGDILDFGFKKYKLKVKTYKLVANIPYNITGAILKKFLSSREKPSSMTLMVQKEVADRIIARDRKESLLSISIKLYGEPKILFKVGRGNFYPLPNVDSAVIFINNISKNNFVKNKIDEGYFWRVIHAGFAHKRKKLSSNLKKYQGFPLVNLKGGGNSSAFSVFSSVLFTETLGNKRAEELSVKNWIELVKMMNVNKKD